MHRVPAFAWQGVRRLSSAFLLVLLALFPARAQESSGGDGDNDRGAASCETDLRYQDLDFWLGEWRVVNPQGVEVGTNRIAKLHAGCLVEENWTSERGWTGQSMNYFDPSVGKWKQDWVDGQGGVVHYEGELRDGAMHFAGQHIDRDGTVALARVVLERLPRGRVHHLIELSRDGGKTWSTYFDGTYIPAGEPIGEAEPPAEPTAAQPPETTTEAVAAGTAAVASPQAPPPPEPEGAAPAQEDRASDKGNDEASVMAVSEEIPEEEIPAADAPQTLMSSPMTLEVTLGPVHLFPEDAAWTTDETTTFICNGVTVTKIRAGREEKRGKVELELGVFLRSRRTRQRVDLAVELRSDGEVVASETMGKITLGRLVPAHDPKAGGLLKSATFTLEKDAFDALFQDDKRPTLRVTLTVP